MRVHLVLWLVPTLLLSACKKSSPEFYKLESQQSLLVAREGDDAWVNPEMDAIVQSLQAIPENAIEQPRAAALIAKVAAEQARVRAERAKPPPPPPVDPFADRYPAPSPERVAPPQAPTESAEDPSAQDAGSTPTQPWPGVDEKTFVAVFGNCFSAGPKATLPDGKPASSYVLATSPDCQKQHGGAKGAVTSYLFTEKGLWGRATQTTEVRDAGTIVIPGPPAPPAPPEPAPIMLMPGAPVPEGYQSPR